MKINLPVTQREFELEDGVTLVSTTDTKGIITHCNQAFVQASGFDYTELLGQPHDIVRHPDVPPEAFKDLWGTIGRGRPWSGIVKNRRKNGDHYWVQANVVPVMENGKPCAYMSVRLKPTRAQIQAAEQAYALLHAQRASGKVRVRLHAGGLRQVGWRDWAGKLHRITLSQRTGLGLLMILVLALLPTWVLAGQDVQTLLAAQGAAGLVGAGLFWAWFRRALVHPINKATRLANDLACCNLNGQIDYNNTSPLGALMRRLWLSNLNMRAIVADVRAEVRGANLAAQDIHQGSVELSTHTETQAGEVEKTTSAVREIANTVQRTADTAHALSTLSTNASAMASEGARAIDQVSASMHAIESSSDRITEIIEVIEKLAFQTNLLALNAAVEAAHAAEHGRGFAVVAAEVRALAQRSSTAAQQIRQLIHDSVEQVSQGTLTVDVAATTIRTAVDAVCEVSARLGEITQATQDEAAGVTQISEAMHLLDVVTQQNAELAQQASADCEGLTARADTLVRAVKVFQMR
ncbi:PAS domain-containing methyl-accepting chemotaxis protein [Rhodoferax sp. U11-2br]|uniref:methyl-accepting chemotaxis protein n=1 Tax=Rhodoferax sp. U11-2br TaxID=2838878 RepID=UPI001BEABCE6|nr:PAS domain-containing methyl-accepting chemotaxis protein [Rhodoferax sp. U11-2br]MBT3066206.1 PAS domain-containing protein [Rhodoferax sp. U11-2br]